MSLSAKIWNKYELRPTLVLFLLSSAQFLCFPFPLLPHPLSCLPSFCKRSFHFLCLVSAVSDCAPLPPNVLLKATLHSSLFIQMKKKSLKAFLLWGSPKRRRPTLPHCGAVPSARSGLTSLFGMGRGGTPRLKPPEYIVNRLLTLERRTRGKPASNV